jgi:hypothetical protein
LLNQSSIFIVNGNTKIGFPSRHAIKGNNVLGIIQSLKGKVTDLLNNTTVGGAILNVPKVGLQTGT